MKTKLSLGLGKLIYHSTRFIGKGGGSAAPGYYALKLDPNLVEKLSKKIPKNVIITGTNGKTTTSRLLAHFALASGKKITRNSSGSNLERGIASALITQKTDVDLGIWELDEAAFNSVAPKLNPDIVVFLNVFRDQLDRYGEVDSIVKKWSQTLPKFSPKTQFLINGDDASLRELSIDAEYFGLKDQKILGEKRSLKTQRLNFQAEKINLKGLSGSEFYTTNRPSTKIKLPLPGLYHIYDFLAAFYTGLKLGFDPDVMINSLENFIPAFGRLEKIEFEGKVIYIMLIKNPRGASEVFQTISTNIDKNDRFLFALNDNFADGTDVSWIWDAEFEQISNQINSSYVSGTRALDMGLRLKYAGLSEDKISLENDLYKALQQAKSGNFRHLYMFTTYTALLELQSILTKMGIKQDYWRQV